jgi:hypothetical protein
MIKFNFKLFEDEIARMNNEKFQPYGDPVSTYWEWMPEGTFELIIDGEKMPDIWRPCPIISLAAQFLYILHHIEVGETNEICFMDDGGSLHVSRPDQDTITISNRHLTVPPISCNFNQLREASVVFVQGLLQAPCIEALQDFVDRFVCLHKSLRGLTERKHEPGWRERRWVIVTL